MLNALLMSGLLLWGILSIPAERRWSRWFFAWFVVLLPATTDTLLLV
jgi:hypothetical protein